MKIRPMAGRQSYRAIAFTTLSFLFAPGDEAATANDPLILLVETVTVGPGGTETLASDEAQIFPGRGAFVEREVTLSGRKRGKSQAREVVRFRAEIRVSPEGNDGAIPIDLKSRVEILTPSGGIRTPPAPLMRATSARLARGASFLFGIYESAALGTRISLNVRWFPAGETEAADVGGTPIPLVVRLYEMTPGEPLLINENLLHAALGGSASATFSRNVGLPESPNGEKRFRQEVFEVTLTPLRSIGQDVSLDLRVKGEVTTQSSSRVSPRTLSHEGRYFLSGWTPVVHDLLVLSGGEQVDGWSRLVFRLEFGTIPAPAGAPFKIPDN